MSAWFATNAAPTGGRPGRHALLVPPRDPVALAQSFLTLVDAPRLRCELGLAAARAVRQDWLYARVVQKLKTAYADSIRLHR